MGTCKILLTNDTIEFLGFDLLKQKITFCLYSGGIVISPGWKSEKQTCHYESILDDNRKIYDPFLVKMLKERGIIEQNNFVKIHNHYFESTPHKMP